MKKLACVLTFFLSIFVSSCKDTTTGPANNSQSPLNATTLFVGQSANINLQIPEPLPTNAYVDYYGQNEWLSKYCDFWVGLSDTSGKMPILHIQASNLTPGPVTGLVKITVGKNTYDQQITINVIDFYYASRLDNNTNDTIKLRSGVSSLLQLTCRDSAGNIVSSNQISRLLQGGVGGGYIVFPHPYNPNDAIFCSNFYRDTTSYYYVFSTIPNVTFSAQDTGQYFRMQISNKIFKIPIQLVN